MIDIIQIHKDGKNVLISEEDRYGLIVSMIGNVPLYNFKFGGYDTILGHPIVYREDGYLIFFQCAFCGNKHLDKKNCCVTCGAHVSQML